jgi:hypothetical protein
LLLAFVSASFPAASQAANLKLAADNQTTSGGSQPTAQGGAMGATGSSQAGVAGKQGNKSGATPTVAVGEGAAAKVPGGLAPAGTADEPSTGSTPQDTSGVKGLPGSKSGPTQKSPSK